MSNTLTINAADSIVFSNAQTTMGGWRWDGQTLRHTTRMYITLTAEKSAEIVAAIAAAVPSDYRELTGAQVAALPEAERTGYQYAGTSNDVTGIYSKLTVGQPSKVVFTKADVVNQGRA